MHQTSMPTDYHAWGAMQECYQRYTPKLTNTAKLETALSMTWNDLSQEFMEKAIISIRNRFQSCVAAAGGHSKQ